MAELKALCMRDRDANNKPTMQTMLSPVVIEKNGRYSAKGKCAKCGGNMFKFLSKDDAMKLK
jgi:predicted  nucleic acid-binding Zn-ribbon protein